MRLNWNQIRLLKGIKTRGMAIISRRYKAMIKLEKRRLKGKQILHKKEGRK